MQSEVADFALSAATWRTGRDICVVFDPGSFALLCKTCRRLQNRKYITYCIAARGGLRKFSDIWTCGF